jgi:serine/threonine-protein phosphatase PGAM5
MKRLLHVLTMLLACAGPAFAADPFTSAGLRTIYLIRHGIYDRDTSVDDHIGNGLNPLGREQAKLIGARLAALPVRMTSLTSSTLTRARETADVMGREMRMTPWRDSLLNECTPATYREDIMKGLAPGEADSAEAQLGRAWERYVRASAEDAHDVLVCHGNVIRWFTCKALGLDTRRWSSMEIANGSLTALIVHPDGAVRLVTYSDVGHLPVTKQTWTGKGGNWVRAAEPARPRAKTKSKVKR